MAGSTRASLRLTFQCMWGPVARPVARPLVFLFFCLVKVLRVISPKYPNLNGLLHKTIHWGLRTFVTPEGNRVILRHFHVGSELTAFVRETVGPVRTPKILHVVAALPRNPVGKVVRFNSIPFRVVGVLKKKGYNSMGMDQDDLVLAPYTTVMKRDRKSVV